MHFANIEDSIDVLIDYRGKTPKKTTSGVRLITAKVIKSGRITDTSYEYIAEHDYETWMRRGLPKLNDILITTEAPLGEVAKIKTSERIALAQRVILLRAKEGEVDSDYLLYALQSPLVQGNLFARATGTTVAGIKQSELRQVEIPQPAYEIQKKVGRILAAYDALIENNRRRIAIHEEIAQSLYHEWFVKFRFPGHEQCQMIDSPFGMIPEGWELKAFTDLATFMNGFAFKSTHFSNSGLAVVKIPELRNGPTAKTPFCLKDKVPEKYLIENGDLIFSWSGSFVIKEWTFGDALLNQHLFKVTPLVPSNKRFIEISLQAALPKMLSQSVGATMKHIRRSTLTETKTIVPPLELLNLFNSQVNCLIDLAVNLQKKNHNLKKQRDLLLPKLISGQIEL